MTIIFGLLWLSSRPPRLAGDGTLSNSVVGHHAIVHASTRTRRRHRSSVAGRNHDSRELIESMPRLFRSFGLIWLLKKHLGPHKSGFIFLFLSWPVSLAKSTEAFDPSSSISKVPYRSNRLVALGRAPARAAPPPMPDGATSLQVVQRSTCFRDVLRST